MSRKKYQSMHNEQKNQNIKQKMKATSALIFQESQEKMRHEREEELNRKMEKYNTSEDYYTLKTKKDENNISLIDQQKKI